MRAAGGGAARRLPPEAHGPAHACGSWRRWRRTRAPTLPRGCSRLQTLRRHAAAEGRALGGQQAPCAANRQARVRPVGALAVDAAAERGGRDGDHQRPHAGQAHQVLGQAWGNSRAPQGQASLGTHARLNQVFVAGWCRRAGAVARTAQAQLAAARLVHTCPLRLGARHHAPAALSICSRWTSSAPSWQSSRA